MTEPKRRRFVAVQSGTVNGVYTFLHTNENGCRIENDRGLTTDECLSFLLSLGRLRYRSEHKLFTLIFIWYGASYDVEMILRDVPRDIKDQIFKGHPVYYQFKPGVGGYKIKYVRGKFLSLHWVDKSFEAVRGVVLFDLFSFFSDSIVSICQEYLGECPPEIFKASSLGPLWNTVEYASVLDYAGGVCDALQRVAVKLDKWFLREGVNLTRWYGPSAAANAVLVKWGARKQFTPLSKEQTPQTLWQAVTSAYYGGRIESLKLGTIEGVHVYDINSAYPSAIALLSRTDQPWQFSNSYIPDADMSVWLIEYDLPNDCYLGLLPHRFSTGRISYHRKGRGWYYQPEVRAIVEAYPDRVRVLKGYYQNYFNVTFGREVERLYKRRLKLKEQGDKAQHCLKILLVALYGKFAQRVGSPAFKCLPWAGWITSYTRAQLLKAVRGNERDIIAFCADAIHSRVPLPIDIGTGLGQWSSDSYAKGLYVMSGVYHLTAGERTKQASRGFEVIDWTKALDSLNSCGKIQVDLKFFVGHRLANQYRLRFGDSYLQFCEEVREIDPKQYGKRWYRFEQIADWSTDYCESVMMDTPERLNSQPMLEDEKERLEDMAIDYLVARGDLNLL